MAEWCGLCRYEDHDGAEEPCIDCVQAFEEIPTEFSPKRPHKPKATRADLIRASTDEELARAYAYRLASCYGCEASTIEDCVKCTLDWLRQEATT